MALAPIDPQPLVLAGGAITRGLSDAGRAIGAYAFATTPLNPAPVPAAVGPGPRATVRAKWSAEIYDFKVAERGPLTHYDLMVNIALSSQIKAPAIAGMLAIVDEVNAELAQISDDKQFWNLPHVNVKNAPKGSALWRMWRAVELLDAVPDVAFTIAHKTLHHKRPELFPLLDNETTTLLPYADSWKMIHADLTNHAAAFSALEAWFASEAAARNRPCLTRLRMHDIIVWLTVKEQWAEAVQDGTALGF